MTDALKNPMGQRWRIRTKLNSRMLARLLSVAMVATILVGGSNPALAAGSFADDDGSVHESAIEAIFKAKITVGCAPERFCPENAVTRGEMAAFLNRAFDLKSSGSDAFTDDTQSIFHSDINAIARAEITRGCNPPANTSYCAEAPVTRGQMASFLIRAMNKESARKGNNPFSDIGSSAHSDDIRRLAKLGITKGCNPPANTKFCPEAKISRAEMATFLARALDLEVLPPPTPDDPPASTGPGNPPPSTPGNPPPSTPGNPPANPDPITIPSNAVYISPGASIQAAVDRHGTGTTFVLRSGTHTGQQVKPKAKNVFVGEANAVMDGKGKEFAFRSNAKDVTIYGIEIKNYKPNKRDGAVHGDGNATNWRVEGNEIHSISEVGVKARADWLVYANHIHHNGRYGIQGHGNGIVFMGNDLSYNANVYGATGSSGGSKFIESDNIILANNFVHHNYGNGLWVDINNSSTLIEGNTVEDNQLNGINIEISCGVTIRNNELSGNGFGSPYPSWMTGSAILVSNTPNASVHGNSLNGNAKGIGGVHWDHPNLKAVTKCTPDLKNYKVWDNTINQSDGAAAGLDAKVDLSQVWDSWGNKFSDNSYSLSSGARFRWDGGWVTHSEWRSAGQG